jgi:cell division protein FtsL
VIPSGKRGRRRPGLRVVRPAAPRRIPFLVLALALLGAAVLGIVTMQALVSETAFAVQKLAKANTQLQQSNDQLRLEAAQLAAPGRIAAEAKRLGMVTPTEVETITVTTSPPPTTGPVPSDGTGPGADRPRWSP